MARMTLAPALATDHAARAGWSMFRPAGRSRPRRSCVLASATIAAIWLLPVPVRAQSAMGSPDLHLPVFQANEDEKARQSPVAPADPYPIEAAGWGGVPTQRFFISRWVEDWSTLRAQGKAPPLKAMPLFGDVTLTVNGELRMRSHFYDDGLLAKGNDYHEFTFRAVLGASLQVGEHFRLFGEVAHGDSAGTGHPSVNSATAAYDSELSAQQVFAEAKDTIHNVLFGVIGGRFEYGDGPRQLVSISNGPDLHRTWNGARFYLHTDRFRVGAFFGHPTQQGFGVLDETLNHQEDLEGFTASIAVVRHHHDFTIFLDPAFYRNYNAKDVAGADTAAAHRDTFGARLWGKKDALTFDWMAYRQTGEHGDRPIRAWLASLNQSLLLTPEGWRPRIGLRVELTSGGGSYGKTGPINAFVAQYQSTSYLGSGHLIGDTNLALAAPTVAFSPLHDVTVNAEYDLVRRMDEHDAFYSSGDKPYAGTQNVPGYTAGGYGRMVVDWAITRNLAFLVEGDHLSAGPVLRRAGFGGGNYGLLSLQFRY